MFEEVKRELSHTPVLALYHPNRETTVSADASSVGAGAVFLQRHKEVMGPVAYAIRAMTATEQSYSQIEKESFGDDMVSGDILRLPVWDASPCRTRP